MEEVKMTEAKTLPEQIADTKTLPDLQQPYIKTEEAHFEGSNELPESESSLHKSSLTPIKVDLETTDIFVISQDHEILTLDSSGNHGIVEKLEFEEQGSSSTIDKTNQEVTTANKSVNQEKSFDIQNNADTAFSKPEASDYISENNLQERDMIFESEDKEPNQVKPKLTSNIDSASQAMSSEVCAQSLDDFIDVVTTYKCKFCLFSCCWKSGLKSHIRNCHLGSKILSTSPKIGVSNKTSAPKSARNVFKSVLKSKCGTASKNKMTVPSGHQNQQSKESTHDNDTSERHIFLCGECSKGFDTFDLCRKHMYEDHKFSLQGGNQSSKTTSENEKKVPGQKEQKKYMEEKDDYDYEAELEEDGNEDALFERKEKGKLTKQNHSKRSVRTEIKRAVKMPKDFESDYLFENKKKRESKGRISDKPFRCSEGGCVCGFMTETNLEYHRQCHAGEENLFTCPECSQGFDQWRCLLLHLWKEHLIDLDLLTCSECGYKTYSQFKLETHQKIHSDVRDYMCSTCGKSFKQLSQLRNHNVMHIDRSQVSSNGQKRWYNTQQCDTCGRSFSDSKCLRKHQQAVHSKIKPFICNFCGHTSARKAMLQLHMRQHTGEKPFTCEHCDYKTGDHNSLRRHRMRHTGSKPYKCSHCPYSCIQAISLKTHLKNKHPGSEGLFSCTMCNFRSVSKDNFVHHLSDHKRGIIPTATSTVSEKAVTVGITEASQLNLHSGGTTQQQTPGNMVSAQLICSCLNVLTADGETVDLPPGCITVGENGTQTITIQIPTNADQETGEQYYFTIQQDLMPGNVTELGLLESTELKLADDEVINVSDFIVNESIPNISELPQEKN